MMEVLGEKPCEMWVVNHYTKDEIKYRSGNKYKIDSPDEFYIYTLKWTKDKIERDVDNNIIQTSTKGLPDEAMYLMINLAVDALFYVFCSGAFCVCPSFYVNMQF